MKLLAIRNHAWLSWLWRLHAIARSRSRCRIRSSSNHANADVDLSLHTRIIVLDSGIPSDEICKRDLLKADDLAADDSLRYLVEFIAVADHPGLGWLRSFNTVTGSGAAWLGCCGSAADDAYADIYFSLYA
jgi:hypothetical protein